MLDRKIFIPFFVFLLLSVPLFSQAVDFQTAWVTQVVDGEGRRNCVYLTGLALLSEVKYEPLKTDIADK